MSDFENRSIKLAELTTHIVCGYLENNTLSKDEVPQLLTVVYEKLEQLKNNTIPKFGQTKSLKPAISIKKSLHDDKLICLECGKSFKSLKRHLGSSHKLTPEEYRYKWDLPASYPVVAPMYAKSRSKIAKSLGLGLKPYDRNKDVS